MLGVMNYWLDLFTGTTWEEFRKAGASISGFRERMRPNARRVKPGDVFLCYVTGVMRWVGALKVVGPTTDASPIWALDTFPVRFAVKPLVALAPEYGVPMERFEGKLDFYGGPQHKGGYKGFLRMSPNLFKRTGDGAIILEALREAERAPMATPLDPRKLAQRPRYYSVEFKKGKTAIPIVVSVPEQDEDEAAVVEPKPAAETTTRHTEIQYHLLKLGAELGLDVWVARNERRGKVKQEIARPTFAYREKPLPKVCGFIGFGQLMAKVDGIRKLGLAGALKPDFLKTTAEYFVEAEDE